MALRIVLLKLEAEVKIILDKSWMLGGGAF